MTPGPAGDGEAGREETHATEILVRGRVQGVGFRWWTRQQLDDIGLVGTATNLPDGTVRVRAEGPPARLDQLTALLRGPTTPGRVDRVDVVATGPTGRPTVEEVLGRDAHGHVRGADHDVVVVGAGPAGLTAAVVLARSRRDVLVLDDGRPRNAASAHVHGYLGYDGASPAALLERGREEVARYGARVEHARVTALEPEERTVRVRTSDGRSTVARRVLVTTGLLDELPDVPGLRERWGRDVLHCPYCHGWELRDASLVVLATSPAHAEKALVVRQWSGAVQLVLDGVSPDDLDEVTRRRLAAADVTVRTGSAAEVVVAEDRVCGVRLTDGEVLPCQAVVVQPRVRARAELLESLGVGLRADDDAALPDLAHGATVHGLVMAAGNVLEPQAQVVTAAAEGHRAAVALDHALVLEDADEAVARTAPRA